MNIFYLIRHGATDVIGKTLTGRASGVFLNRHGEGQVAALGQHLAKSGIARVFASPLERTQQTAKALAEPIGLQVQTAEGLIEVDFGDWTGNSFAELDQQQDWRAFNAFRSGARIPGGESMLQAQARIVGFMQELRKRHPDERIALVSHGDVIKAAVAYYLGVPLDLFQRIEISPASVSVVGVDAWGARILCVNHTEPGPQAG